MKLLESTVPNSVRFAIFGDEFLILGWYFYAALGARATEGIPDLEVKGHQAFGVLIDKTSRVFEDARRFLRNYESGLCSVEQSL